MFIVELVAGILSHSSALTSDSLDMFGDALIYGFSLYVIARGPRWRAYAGLLKGWVMAGFGTAAIGAVIYRFIVHTPPDFETMGLIGALALVANVSCLFLLYRHKQDDINMRSTWLCSRNDVIANLTVLGAAALVYFTGLALPDAAVGLGIAALFLHSALEVIRESREELATTQPKV
jgi:Co/Zn/Cd efflux system component